MTEALLWIQCGFALAVIFCQHIELNYEENC